MSTIFTIGQLASAAQTPAATIRYYEKIGLLATPARSGSNYRRYSEDDLARLTFVRRARDIGFTVEQVRSLLAFSNQQEANCCEVMAMTAEHLQAIEQKILDLVALKEHLSSWLSACQGGLVADCRIIEALRPTKESALRLAIA
jgi:Cu(I)-responsive transcriptional regulator